MIKRAALRASWCASLLLGAPLTAGSSPAQSPDTAFLLQTSDPARRPSPFIGNGHLGMVVPALGIGPAPAYMAGLYEEAPGDIPRIVSLPAFSILGLYDGKDWLLADSTVPGSVHDYRQTLDMRSGTAHT